MGVPHVEGEDGFGGEPVVTVRTRLTLSLLATRSNYQMPNLSKITNISDMSLRRRETTYLGMAGQVAVHVALLVEAPAAERAGKGLLAMNLQVALNTAGVAEDLATDVTLFLTRRHLPMGGHAPRSKT